VTLNSIKSAALTALTLTIAALAPGLSASAQEAGNFFAGKQVRIIVATGPGGGYDTFARLVARHLGQFVPGHPTLIVENMPGASGIKAVNFLYSAAPKDGTVLATFNNAIPLYQATGQQGIAFKSEELSWIGSLTQTATVIAVMQSAGVKSIDDVRKKEVILGATGAAGSKVTYPTMLNNVLGTKFKIVAGYASSKPVMLAMERNEVQGDGGNPWSSWQIAKPDWIKEGKLVPLVQIGLRKEKSLASVPLLTDLATTDEQRAMFAFISQPVAIQQPFAGPPGMPADRLAVYRQAFEKMTQDPAFRAEVEKAKLDLDPLPGAEVEKIVKSVIGTPVAVVERVKTTMTPKDVGKASPESAGKPGAGAE
jgi:tripartite-type tricarboxylate transporter receptor subunit TctC